MAAGGSNMASMTAGGSGIVSMVAGGSGMMAMEAGGSGIADMMAGDFGVESMVAGGSDIASMTAGGSGVASMVAGGSGVTAMMAGGSGIAAMVARGSVMAAMAAGGCDKHLKETQMKIHQRIQQRQKDLQQLREAVESHKRSAQTAVEDSERIFTELISSIERSRSEVTHLIRDQEEAAVSRAEGRLERLEQEINDLKRRDAELEQLSHTHDHIHFLQSFQSLSAPPESTDEPDDPFSSLFSFDGMRESVRQLRDKLEDFCKGEIKKISNRGDMSKMAEARISVDQNEFTCPVCLDLLKDPVTIPCGHSYCKICITGCWDQEDEKRVYSCPQCRQTFSPRPALGKNTILAEMVEKLKKTKLPADCYAGAGDVQCDVCTGRKYKAVKSCLVCLESFCQTHFDRHEEYHSRKPHKVIDATGRLQDMICHKHDKELEMYCITDQQCICVWCKESEHKNHNTVSTAAQRTEKQKQLKETQMKMRQRIQQRQKDLQQLREVVESHKRSAQTAVEDSERIFTELIRSIERSRSERSAQTAVKDSERIFTELIRSIERSRSEVTQRIRDQEKAAVSRAEGRMERLEQEINDLRRRDAELEQLSHTHDHIHFLQVTEI
ncbi:Tripartite motif-containing protein 47 [Anabarilius grahami]|uniref:Tripartite motif-containing protein 47 n=1 Tax=Anabarilius grahami TaxID=495550 RepID=A0A3N0YU91_ANAGA|nr:Tripartite motif-containing protein 47 [Anabarilius grahami]